MLAGYRLTAMLLVLILVAGCGSDTGVPEDTSYSAIIYRERVDIRSLTDAAAHSVVIQAIYHPIVEEIELLICIPRPKNAPNKAQAAFNFGLYKGNGLYEGKTMLIRSYLPSVIEEDVFETFFLSLHAEFLEKLRVYMSYQDTDEFEATGDLVKSYNIYFDQIAAELIQSKREVSNARDPRLPIPELSCSGE
jgi:hypothetical protein